ncbi:hypothetical protein GCM10009416_30350 [Craurococcus roseus]|uniref:Carbohydrate kinase PfkB domain-containing protein n=1 Tax=Craurococcus roseus TaxID=77585 RepID=A0ABN1FFT7_9PROT
MPVLVFGSVNADLVFALPELPAPGRTVLGEAYRALPGGKGANQAVAAARDGARLALAGAVGRDPLADVALSASRAAGVDLSRVAALGAPTGCAAVCVDPAGRNQIAVASGANALARAVQVEDAALDPGTVLLLQMEVSPAETARLIARARTRGSRSVLNLAPPGSLPDGALQAVDLLVANEHEAAWLAARFGCGADAAALRAALGGGPDVAVTRGEAGAGGGDRGRDRARARLPRRGNRHDRRRRLLVRRAGRGAGSGRAFGGGDAARRGGGRDRLHPPGRRGCDARRRRDGSVPPLFGLSLRTPPPCSRLGKCWSGRRGGPRSGGCTPAGWRRPPLLPPLGRAAPEPGSRSK